jgi:hypothetical protein
MQHKTASQILTTVGLYTAVLLLVSVAQLIISQPYTLIAQNRIYYNILFEVNEKAHYTDFVYYDDPEYFTQFSYAQQNCPTYSF